MILERKNGLASLGENREDNLVAMRVSLQLSLTQAWDPKFVCG
jgi:hypothetical protein